MILAASTLGAMISSSAFAEEGAGSLAADAPRMRLAAQVEVLPLGSAKGTVQGMSSSTDTAVAYGISAGFDYAVHKYFSVGVSPRLVLNVKSDEANAMDDADKELDLRARLVGHFPVSPGLEVYGALTPGYTIGLASDEGVNNASGFAIGGAVGLTYDVSPRMFVGGEVGYQRAFTTTDIDVGTQKISADVDISYLHIGLGAGTRF